MARLRSAVILLLVCALLSIVVRAATEEEATGTGAIKSDADYDAEEEAMLEMRQQAEEEEDEDGGDAMDEDADSARPHPDRHALTNMPEPAHDVVVGHTFVSGDLKGTTASSSIDKGDLNVVTLGGKIESAIVLANTGRSKYHVWGIQGSLNIPEKFSSYVQNFSYINVNASVVPGEELAMAYEFTPNDRLDTRTFQLSLIVFYEAQSPDGNALRGHSTTFYNSTIATKPGPQAVSNSLFMILAAIFVAAVAAATAFILKATSDDQNNNNKPHTANDTSAKKVSETTPNEWLEDHHTTMRSAGVRSKVTKRK